MDGAVEAGGWWGPLRRREGGERRSRDYQADAVALGEGGEVLALGSCKVAYSRRRAPRAQRRGAGGSPGCAGRARCALYFFDRTAFSPRLPEIAAEREDVRLVVARELG